MCTHVNKKMTKSTIDQLQKEEKEALEKAANNVIRRVLKIAGERKDTNPQDSDVTNVDLALINIKYGNFSEEGFFKILRNTNFGTALGISLLVGLVTWTISNLINIFLPTS